MATYSTTHDATATYEQESEHLPTTLGDKKQVAEPAGTASRMIKSISNKRLRNLVSSGKDKRANADTKSSLTKRNRHRSHTLEMLEKQRRGEGQEFRPRKEMPHKDKKTNAAAAMLSPPTRSINKARHRPRSQTLETLAKQRREDEQQTFRPRNDSSLGGAMGRMSQ